MKVRYLFILIPVLLGILVRFGLSMSDLDAPILYLRADLGTLFLLTGISLSALMALGFLLLNRIQRAHTAELEASREDAIANRRRFLQRLDHELKNPLTAAQAGLANLQVSAGAEDDVLQSVNLQIMRLSRLVADLRKISGLGERPIERTPIQLETILEEVVILAREAPGAEVLEFTLNIPHAPWPLPTLYGDPDLLFLAIHNLLANAVKFTEAGDTVEVRASEDGASVLIEVADTGPGIPDDELPYIWQELYRGRGARGIPGSGLGLALVKAIIERHGGSVSVRSRLDEGTVISMRLPAQDTSGP